jgi:phage terminase small subunit
MAKKSSQNGWRPEVKKFYDEIIANFELEVDSLQVLKVGCDALERYLQAKADLDTQGLSYVTDTGQLKKNPVSEIEKVARSQFLMSMRMLGISDVAPNRPGRPTTRAGL